MNVVKSNCVCGRAEEIPVAGIDTEKKRRLVEDLGVLFEDTGLPRMSGRVFGWLLMSSPQHQSAGEIASGLGASKGSMSTMLKMLTQFGMIERFGVPGERSAYYRVKTAYWTGMMQAKMAFIRRFEDIAERALDEVDDSDPERLRRLEETRTFYKVLEEELTSIIARLSGDVSGGPRGPEKSAARLAKGRRR